MGERWDGIRVGRHELGEHFGKADLVFECADGVLAFLPPGCEGAERVYIVAVNLFDVGVRYDYEREPS